MGAGSLARTGRCRLATGLSQRKINTTDPDSRLLYRTGKTAVQGYKRAGRRDGRPDHRGG